MNRIAPNNKFRPTHFMEVYYKGDTLTQDEEVYSYEESTPIRGQSGWVLNLAKARPVAIFRIRENKLPT